MSGSDDAGGIDNVLITSELEERSRAGQAPHESEARQAFLVALGDTLRDLAEDPTAMMAAATEALARYLKVPRVGYAEVDEAVERSAVVQHYNDASRMPEITARVDRLDDHGPPIIAELRAGRVMRVDDLAEDPRTAGAAAEAHAAVGAKATLAAPIQRHGRTVAFMFAHDAAPRRWTDGEAELVRETADRTWAAVERARAVTALRESEARFRHMADSAPALIWMTDAQGQITFANMHYDYVFGRPAADMHGDGWRDIVLPDDVDRFHAAFLAAFAARRPFSHEVRVRDRNGAVRWLRCDGVVRLDDHGTFLGYTGCNIDITDARLAREDLEARVAQRTAELQASEVRLRTIFETSYQYQGLLALDGTLLDANATSLEGIGATRDDVIGKRFWETPWFTGTPGMPEQVRAAVAVVVAGQPWRQEITVDLPTGRRAFDFSMRPVRDATGEVTAIVPEAIEITERRQTEEALRHAQKMEAIGQLTGGVAHDFNNLLTVISSSTDFLRRHDLSDERRRRYVEAIADTAARASTLTAQLLAFARRQPLKPEVFDVSARIGAVAEMLRTLVGGRIQIETHVPGERCFVKADVTQFETALVNMAVNARDAMEGEGTLTVRVEAVSRPSATGGHAGGSGDVVAVSVADTGSGIPPDKLSHVFDPFFTTKEVGKGTGLGLSQVYGFIKQSGGDIAVESQAGQGTTFTLYLPRVEREEIDETAEGRTGPRVATEGGGRRVLVVEDNAEVGTFATQILQDLGYEPTWTANATEALGLLDEDPARFDVVFSDVVMPGMSGIELGQEIRRRFPGLPVVLTSGYSHILAEEGRHGFELLQKPYAVEELSQLLRRVTQGRGAR